MNKWMKRALLVVGAAVLMGGIAVMVVLNAAEQKMARVIQVTPYLSQNGTGTPVTLEHGRYLFNTRGCAECHGVQGSGKLVIDDAGLVVIAPNLTTGPNSAVIGFSLADWDRVVRHGVKRNGRPVMIMPSEDYSGLTNEDFEALVGYIASLPPVAGKPATVQLSPLVKILYGGGVVNDAASKINHALAPPVPVAAEVSLAHGAYVAKTCIGCHGPGLSGGAIPGAPPSWPNAANLTPGEGGVLRAYPTPEGFIAMMRSGKRPNGSQISTVMPFTAFGAMNDVDLTALHLYLGTLAPRAAGQR